jgi:hypothetical protein
MCAVDPIDWRSMVSARPNILLCGEKPFTDACLVALRPYCPAPIETVVQPQIASLSDLDEGAVILEDIDAYSLPHQRDVFRWLDQSNVQLITTTRRSLLSFVKRGEFLEELYYRMNVVYLDLPASQYALL